MVDASDFHGQGVDRQRRDEFNNVGIPSGRGRWSNEDLEDNALQVRSSQPASQREQKSIQSREYSDWKCSLEDPVSEEYSTGVEQFDDFEKVLENSIATSEERVE